MQYNASSTVDRNHEIPAEFFSLLSYRLQLLCATHQALLLDVMSVYVDNRALFPRYSLAIVWQPLERTHRVGTD